MSISFRGFLIRSTLTGETFIEKNGSFIGWAENVDHAKRIIRSLDGSPYFTAEGVPVR